MPEEINVLKRKRNRASQVDIFKMFNLLQENLKVQRPDFAEEGDDNGDMFARYRDDSGMVEYNEGMNDSEIAEIIGVADTTVRDNRRKHFGNLPGSREGFGGSRMSVMKLLARIERIEQQLGIVHNEEEEESDEN